MAERTEWTFQVGGMTCRHCAQAINDALREVPGVVESTTQHVEGRAVVITEDGVEPEALVSAIEFAGYSVVGRSSRTLA